MLSRRGIAKVYIAIQWVIMQPLKCFHLKKMFSKNKWWRKCAQNISESRI